MVTEPVQKNRGSAYHNAMGEGRIFQIVLDFLQLRKRLSKVA